MGCLPEIKPLTRNVFICAIAASLTGACDEESGVGGGQGDADADGDVDADGDADSDGRSSSDGDADGDARPDISGSGDDVLIGDPFTGVATYYDFADGTGACMFDPSPEDMDIAALNEVQWQGSAWCGACADVSGPLGSLRLRIVDLCPGCGHGHLDLSPQAFEKIAELPQGRVDINWQFVSCEVSGPLTYKYKDGANQWWTAVQVRNHKLPIARVEWSPDGSAWHPTERQDYNYFLDASGFGSGPVRIRVTAVDGQVIEDDLPAVASELEVTGTVQFQ